MIKFIFKLFLFIIFLSITLLTFSAEENPKISNFNLGWYFPSINAMVSRTDFHIAINMWLKEFKHVIDIQQTNVKLYDRIENMRTAFDQGELDMIVAPPLLIVGFFNLDTLADGFVGTSNTGKPYGMSLLIRNNSDIKTVADFKNKRLVLPENDLLASIYLNSLLIPEYQQSYQNVFSSTQFLIKQNAIIHKLFFNEADVGVAYLETYNLMVELNPQIKKQVKILDNFPMNSPNYSYFHHQFPEKMRKHFIAEALKLNESVRSQQILNNFRMAALVVCTVDSLAPFIRLRNQNRLFKQKLVQLAR